MSGLGATHEATAGEHYVAFRLTQLGYVVAAAREGSPTADLLVSNRQGSRHLSVQVKTTSWAERKRREGGKRTLYGLQFPMNGGVAGARSDGHVYAFVDLRVRKKYTAEERSSAIPDVYVVPSQVIRDYRAERERLYRERGELDRQAMFAQWRPAADEAREKYREDWKRFAMLFESPEFDDADAMAESEPSYQAPRAPRPTD